MSEMAAGVIERVRLAGYVNPLDMTPAFLLPVFESGGDLFLQEPDAQGRIKGFCPVDRGLRRDVVPVTSNQHVRQGDNLLYGFLFRDGDYAIESKSVLAERLSKEREFLSKYTFLHMEILEFLGQDKDAEDELLRVRELYSSNRLLGKKWVRSERKILEKKTPIHEVSIDARKRHRTEKIGVVTSDKMMKTVVVRVTRIVKHPKYRRYIRRQRKFMAHDDLGATIGDKVRLVETRPLSARKRWRVIEIIQRSREGESPLAADELKGRDTEV